VTDPAGRKPGRWSDLEAAISSAIDHNELVVCYQPIIEVRTGVVQGFEALVRWDRPEGRVLPGEFIPVAEASDMISELDTWVLRRATDQLAHWNRVAGSRRLLVSVNVSGRHVNAPRFRDDVAAAVLGRGDVDPVQVVIEITETVPVDDAAIATLEELRRAGITFSLDDVGAGHSTLNQVSRLPVDLVKIDRRQLDTGSRKARRRFRTMVAAAHARELLVVAEGVERADQLELLEQAGVEFAQGFALGRPMTPVEVSDQWRYFSLPLPPAKP
jgi:EAL domain-containing protein (putative c-di-GMP-specific phosphodiesterase class I)